MKYLYMWTNLDDKRRFIGHTYTTYKPQIEQQQVIHQSYLSTRLAFETLGYKCALSDRRKKYSIILRHHHR